MRIVASPASLSSLLVNDVLPSVAYVCRSVRSAVCGMGMVAAYSV